MIGSRRLIEKASMNVEGVNTARSINSLLIMVGIQYYAVVPYQATLCNGSASVFRLEVLTTEVENKFVISILSIQLTMYIVVLIIHVSNLIIVAYIVNRMNRMVEFIIGCYYNLITSSTSTP